MPGPGFKPGLLPPQRSVLTTKRSRLTKPPTDGWREKVFLFSQTIKFLYYRQTLNTFYSFK